MTSTSNPVITTTSTTIHAIPCLLIDIPWLRTAGLHIYFRGGMYSTTTDKMQTAHLLEHLTMRGPAGDPLSFSSALERQGIVFNAGVHREWMVFTYRFPEETVYSGITHCVQALFNPVFWTEAHLAIERDTLRSELQHARRNLGLRACQIAKSYITGVDHDQIEIKTQIEQLDAITLDDVLTYRAQHLCMRNSFLVIFGAQPTRFIARIQELFPECRQHQPLDWPQGQSSSTSETGIRLTLETPQPIHIVSIANPLPGYGSPEQDRSMLLYGLLMFGMGGYIYHQAVLDHGLTYTILKDIEFRACSGVGVIYAQLRQHDAALQFYDIVHHAFNRLCDGDIHPADITRARERYLTYLRMQSEHPEAWVKLLGKKFIYGDPTYDLEQTIAWLYHVTPADLVDLAQTYFSRQSRVSVIVKEGSNG